MNGIFVGTGREPFVIEFEDELQNYQALVGGRIDSMTIKEDEKRSVDLVFNDDFLYLFEEVNRTVIFKNGNYVKIKGNFLCVIADEETGDYVDMTDEEVTKYLSFLKDEKLLISKI